MALPLREAALALLRAVRAQPRDYRALHELVGCVAESVRRGERLFEDSPRPARSDDGEPVSVIVCSIDSVRLRAMQDNFRAHLEGREHEFVVIDDARSLAEGYTRGLRSARHDLVVFSHDDVEVVSSQPFQEIVHALGSCDIVGLAGSRLANGPAVMWAGHPHIHGWVSYPDPQPGPGFLAAPFSLESGVLAGMQCLDGLFFAARRAAVLRIGFDAETFDGFHFYDFDFSLRAHFAGLRLAVTTDVLAIHASEGSFDDSWKRYAARFQAKYPALNSPKGDHHAYGARLADRRQLVAFHAQLRALGRAP